MNSQFMRYETVTGAAALPTTGAAVDEAVAEAAAAAAAAAAALAPEGSTG